MSTTRCVARARPGHRAFLLAAAIFAGGCAPLGPAPGADREPVVWAAHTSTSRWNEYACELIARNQVGQFPAVRVLAYVNLAIHDAIASARRQGRQPDGAAAGAAAATLAFFFPKDEPAISSRLSGEIAALGAARYRPEFATGVDIGRAAAADVIALAKDDRASQPWAGTVPTGEDKWRSLAKPPSPPLAPQLVGMRTFFVTSPSEFRAPPPPALDSVAFKENLAEVRRISDARSVEQVRIAQFWEGLTGPFNAGNWNGVARDAIAMHRLDEAQAARVLALVHMAAFDANIACHDSKNPYRLPRPTQLDPDITLAIALPNHPSYPSNHACVSGTFGRVLDGLFPDARGLYGRMAREAGESRIYAGIHYRIDLEQGWTIADKVSGRALQVGVPVDGPFTPRGR